MNENKQKRTISLDQLITNLTIRNQQALEPSNILRSTGEGPLQIEIVKMADDDAVWHKSVRMPTFSGTEGEFQIFWVRYRAYAEVHDFARALVTDPDMPADNTVLIDPATDEGKLAKAAVKRNKIAMANFTMAFASEGTMSLIYKAETSAWPNGLASLVTDALKAKYMPQDTVTRVELRQMLNKVSMKPNSNPAVIFEQISTIKNRYCAARELLTTRI